MTSVAIASSADGQFAVFRRGTTLSVIDGGEAAVQLPSDEVDLAVVGPPHGVVAVLRTPTPRVVLYALPELDAAATFKLDAPMSIATTCGGRVVLATADRRRFVIVRAAARALAGQALDPGLAAEFAVGLDKNQLLLGLPRKLEVWDPIAGRPTVRLQLQLPPPPRTVGASLGHVWATRAGSDEVFVYRLSDGRPFRHHVGSPVERAIAHPSSPVVVLVTARGLVRMHCFAHSMSPIDIPDPPNGDVALALHGTGDDISLLGATPTGEVWKTTLDAPQATGRSESRPQNIPVSVPVSAPVPSPVPASFGTTDPARASSDRPDPAWRVPLATTAAELARAERAAERRDRPFEFSPLPDDCELSLLVRELSLGEPAHRALALIYGLSLANETLSIAGMARALGDWTEPLGQGELGTHELIRRTPTGVVLRRWAAMYLDGTRGLN